MSAKMEEQQAEKLRELAVDPVRALRRIKLSVNGGSLIDLYECGGQSLEIMELPGESAGAAVIEFLVPMGSAMPFNAGDNVRIFDMGHLIYGGRVVGEDSEQNPLRWIIHDDETHPLHEKLSQIREEKEV